MNDNFMIMIETWHKPDLGEQENVSLNQVHETNTWSFKSFKQRTRDERVLCFVQVHNLDPETWKKVDVVYIDIADKSQVNAKVSKWNFAAFAAGTHW